MALVAPSSVKMAFVAAPSSVKMAFVAAAVAVAAPSSVKLAFVAAFVVIVVVVVVVVVVGKINALGTSIVEILKSNLKLNRGRKKPLVKAGWFTTKNHSFLSFFFLLFYY